MTTSSFRTLTAIALTALLAACGAGQQDTLAPTLLASSVSAATPAVGSTSSAAAAAVSAGTAATAPVAAAIAAASPNMPAPDCAPEACASLRIIDGNAEAYRIDAMRRAAADGSDQS